eukprot:2560422-Heterocapsa_arctica.AAC.1
METTYLPRAVPDKRKNLCIDEFHLFYDDFLLYAEESAMREMEQLSILNLKLQAAVFHYDFQDVRTTCNYKVKNFEVHRVAPPACVHQDGGRLNDEADGRTNFSASVKQS